MKKVRFSSGREVIVSDRIPDYFLHSCYQEEVYREMRQADIIVAKDENREHLLWGAAVYRKIISKGEARHCKVLRIPIDSSDEFQDLEWLIACVKNARGACCYQL